MNNGGSVRSTLFRAREVLGLVTSITLAQGQTAIRINPVAGVLGDSPCYCIAIGEDPQLMQPLFITNNITNSILSLPIASPNLIDMTPASAWIDYAWRLCDSSVRDMFFRYWGGTSTGTAPVYVSRTTKANIVEYVSGDFILPISNVGSYYNITVNSGAMPSLANYCLVQLGQLAYVVNDANITDNIRLGGVGGNLFTRYQTTYLVSDGKIMGQAIYDYGTTPLPKPKYLTVFQESIIAGGGVAGSEAYDKIYCSNAYNPYNFSDSGSGTNLAFIGLEAAGEPIMGLGIFSISTADNGINTQLVIGSRTKLFKLSSIPSAADFGSAYLDQLSNRIGLANHYTLVNTEVGTIICGLDDVYLLRDSGEPTPIGQDIADFFKSSDQLGQNSSFWSAVYHDGHYKLAYSKPGSAIPDQELWLNLRKMKANKGKPSWYGPHTGRAFQFSIVDTPLAAGELEKRIIIDIENDRNHFADDPAYQTDLGVMIPTIFETKDTVGEGGEYHNKKLVYFQLRGRATSLIEATASWYVDGFLAEVAKIAIRPKMDNPNILTQATQVFPFYPAGRIRGRTLRLKVETLTLERIGISGFFIGVRAEARRI